jgi:hypothetical protein
MKPEYEWPPVEEATGAWLFAAKNLCRAAVLQAAMAGVAAMS